MKRIITFVSFYICFFFLFSHNVGAKTIGINELHVGEWIHSGDIIDCGNGEYILEDGIVLNDTELHLGIVSGYMGSSCLDITLHSGETWTAARDLYIANRGILDGIPLVSFGLRDIDVKLSSSYKRDGIERIVARCTGGVQPLRYYWGVWSKSGKAYSDNTSDFIAYPGWLYSEIITTEPYLDIDYHDIAKVNICVLDSSNEDEANCGCGYTDDWYEIDDSDEPSTANNPKEQVSGTSKDNESAESSQTGEHNTPQTPSTVPNGTVQVSIGTDNKTYSNIKALNQFPHDAVNQKIIADLYAAKLKKRTDILMQKNLFPPHGVKNDWKSASHTVKWNNLNVKKGDNIIIVWYTPAYWGHTPNLQIIQATVVADGTIEFTIPSMGDMSVMSIFKLK